MNAIARLILELLSLWEQFKAKQKQANRDEEVEQARNDPADFINSKFGGVSNDPRKEDKPDNAEN